MTTNSYNSRTTLWDDQVSSDPSALQPIPARSGWRAPSAALSQERGGRKPVSSVSAGARERNERSGRADQSERERPERDRHEVDLDVPIRRRPNFVAARSTWWRPRTTFGRVLLGTGTLLVLSTLVGAGILTRSFLRRDAHFRILGASAIQSTGLSEVNRTEVLPVFGEDIGRNIFFVPLSERRKQLESIPWVKQATVMRFLPDHLSVSIVERTPVAFVRQGQSVELADAEGVILSMPPAMMAQHHYSFPVITGIDQSDSLASRRSRMAVYQRFLTELDQNQQHLTAQVSEIDLSDPEDLRATMPEEGTDILAHFGEDQFLHRLGIYKAHIAEWRQRYPKLIGVDLRYNGEVPLEMASDSGPASGPATAKIAAISTAAKPVIKPLKATAPRQPKALVASTIRPKARPAAPTSAAQRRVLLEREKAAKLRAARAKAAKEKANLHSGKQGQ